MPEAVFVELRCLTCGSAARSSVGLELDDAERLETAEAAIAYNMRRCRERHAGGVRATFTDQPDRSITFSRAGGGWDGA